MKQINFIIVITFLFGLSCSDINSDDKKIDSDSKEKEIESKEVNSDKPAEVTLTTSDNSLFDETVNLESNFNLYWIRDLEENHNKKVGFISASEIYPLSEHPDSLPVPILENVELENYRYFKLNTEFRKRFLTKTKISESDSVFVYDYDKDVLFSFSVKKLNVVAFLNDYMDVNECPCNPFDYMIGFEIPKSNLKGLGKYFSESLVFIGKENPFLKGQMKAIAWKRMKSEKFPIDKSKLTEEDKRYKNRASLKGQAYQYETNKFQVFIQDFTEAKYKRVLDRHLMVIDKNTGDLVVEHLFSSSEGASVAPLNFGIDNAAYPDLKAQWVGKLFKNQPEVIFGFEWVSFGCPGILFINSQKNFISIKCDNRH